MPYSRACDHCGKNYKGFGKRFCSRECMRASGVCIHTGPKEIARRRKIGEANRGKRRSREWREAISRAKKGKGRGRKPRPRRTCKQCGIEYEGWGKMFCSNTCAGAGRKWSDEVEAERRRKISESQTGKKLPKEWCESISRGKKGVKLTEEQCRNMHKFPKGNPPWNKGKAGLQVAWNKGKENVWSKGEKNVNWKGGVTPANKAFRESLEYAEWRRKVFERDDWTCTNCQKRGVKLQADHINPFCLYPDLRLDLDNGRTLCKPCHDAIGWQLFREANPRKRKAGPMGDPAVA